MIERAFLAQEGAISDAVKKMPTLSMAPSDFAPPAAREAIEPGARAERSLARGSGDQRLPRSIERVIESSGRA